MAFLVLAAATMMVGANAVEVRSATHCPSAEEVAARLRPMLPGGWRLGPSGDVASVEVVEARADGVLGLHLRLLRPDGSLGGDRRLVLEGGCEEMADAVATVIATWEIDFPRRMPRLRPVCPPHLPRGWSHLPSLA